jgi:hypothetical protein
MNQSNESIKSFANHLMLLFRHEKKFKKQSKKIPEFDNYLYQYFIGFIITNTDLSEFEIVQYLFNTKKVLMYNVLERIEMDKDYYNRIDRQIFDENI